LKASPALQEFFNKFFNDSDVDIDSIEVFLKLIEEIAKLKRGEKGNEKNQPTIP
jgi:hypothetical protein